MSEKHKSTPLVQ